MQIAIPLYDRFTALDAVGPYEVLSRLPGAELTFVGFEVGPGPDRQRPPGDARRRASSRTSRTRRSSSCPAAGARGRCSTTSASCPGSAHAHENSQWTTSVCTGSLLLGAAGVLDGLEATSHWLEVPALAEYGARPTEPPRGRAGQGDHGRRRLVRNRHGPRRSRRRSPATSSRRRSSS